MSTTPQPAGFPAYRAAIASCVTRRRAPAGATRARSSRPRSRWALRSPPAADSTIASASRPPRASFSAAPMEPCGSDDASRFAPPPAPRPTTSPPRSTAKARVFVAPASMPTTSPLFIRWPALACASRYMERSTRDRPRGAGRARQRVRQAAQAVRAEDGERDRLAVTRGHAVRRGEFDLRRRDRRRDQAHERRIVGAAAGDQDALETSRRLARDRAGDRARAERGRRGERVVVRAAVLAHQFQKPRGKWRAEQLAARAL